MFSIFLFENWQLFILVFSFTSMDFDNVLYSISNSVETKLGLGFEINKLLELKDLFRFCKNTAFCLVGPSENDVCVSRKVCRKITAADSPWCGH